jgi:hypothetical protein
VITTAPSPHSRLFVLQMEADAKKDDERWEKIQQSVDLLFAMMEVQDDVHQQMSAQMDLTMHELTQ